MKEIEVGRVADYFAHIGVVAIEVTAEGIKVGVEVDAINELTEEGSK